MRASAVSIVAALSVALLGAQTAPKWKSTAPINDRPNPYRRDANWAQLPSGLKWGVVKFFIEDIESTTTDHSGAEGVGVDRDGNVYGPVVRRMMLEKHVLTK
jgi:hypothetical protein